MEDLNYIESILTEPGQQQVVSQYWAKIVMEKHRVEITVPRQTAQRKKGTDTPQFTDAKSYYESKFYVPYLSKIQEIMKLKFGGRNNVIPQLALLVPITVTQNKPSMNEFRKAFDFDRDDLPDDFEQFRIQYELYFYWTTEKVLESGICFNRLLQQFLIIFCTCSFWFQFPRTPPGDASSALADMEASGQKQKWPIIYTLLFIYAVVPVTSAGAERSFSVLKLEKTYLRRPHVQWTLEQFDFDQYA